MPRPNAGPALAPAALLPTFQRAAQMTGVPVEILLGIARVESGFDPYVIGPLIERFAGTEDAHALGLMQFLPSTYRGYYARVDALTGRNLGMNGVWDPDSAIYAAALYLRDNGAPGDMRRALFAYNNANWYVDLILAWSAYYAGGVIPDSQTFNFDGQGRPVVIAAPENPQLPVQSGLRLDVMSPIPLYAPFLAGQIWHAGAEGSFYGSGYHTDAGGGYYAVDFNKGSVQQPEEDAGQPVLAAADGIINNIYATATGGWTVEMYHRTPEGTLMRSVYLHLNDDPRVTANIRVNQPVVHGTTIGFVGSTGTTSTGAHLHFAVYVLKDGSWVSIRPEPMEGQFLADGTTIVSHNDPAGRRVFDQAWNMSDKTVTTGRQRTWLWGPAPFTSGLAEGYFNNERDNMRLVQYYDKGRMEASSDGKGGYTITAGKIGRELVTGQVDLGQGRTANYGPAQVPIVGGVSDKQAPTYADVGVEAVNRTLDYKGLPVAWRLERGGKIVPFTPPVAVSLTDYDVVAGHNIADVFAQWLGANGFSDPLGIAGGLAQRTQYAQLAPRGRSEGAEESKVTTAPDFFGPGRPLSDPFWVIVTIDGAPKTILVQVFERWTLTYTPDNPAGWQIELANVGRHYYEWRYEQESLAALRNEPGSPLRRRRKGQRVAEDDRDS